MRLGLKTDRSITSALAKGRRQTALASVALVGQTGENRNATRAAEAGDNSDGGGGHRLLGASVLEPGFCRSAHRRGLTQAVTD